MELTGTYFKFMIHLIYENGAFNAEKPFENQNVEIEDVNLVVKDVVPESQLFNLAQLACEFINQEIGTNYQTNGVGSNVSLETKQIAVISEFNFRMCKK